MHLARLEPGHSWRRGWPKFAEAANLQRGRGRGAPIKGKARGRAPPISSTQVLAGLLRQSATACLPKRSDTVSAGLNQAQASPHVVSKPGRSMRRFRPGWPPLEPGGKWEDQGGLKVFGALWMWLLCMVSNMSSAAGPAQPACSPYAVLMTIAIKARDRRSSPQPVCDRLPWRHQHFCLRLPISQEYNLV